MLPPRCVVTSVSWSPEARLSPRPTCSVALPSPFSLCPVPTIACHCYSVTRDAIIYVVMLTRRSTPPSAERRGITTLHYCQTGEYCFETFDGTQPICWLVKPHAHAYAPCRRCGARVHGEPSIAKLSLSMPKLSRCTDHGSCTAYQSSGIRSEYERFFRAARSASIHGGIASGYRRGRVYSKGSPDPGILDR